MNEQTAKVIVACVFYFMIGSVCIYYIKRSADVKHAVIEAGSRPEVVDKVAV